MTHVESRVSWRVLSELSPDSLRVRDSLGIAGLHIGKIVFVSCDDWVAIAMIPVRRIAYWEGSFGGYLWVDSRQMAGKSGISGRLCECRIMFIFAKMYTKEQ